MSNTSLRMARKIKEAINYREPNNSCGLCKEYIHEPFGICRVSSAISISVSQYGTCDKFQTSKIK